MRIGQRRDHPTANFTHVVYLKRGGVLATRADRPTLP